MIYKVLIALAIAFGVIAAPSVSAPSVITEENEQQEWAEFHSLAVAEYEDEFTALFNSYETKWSKNGRLMLRTGNAGSYKFVAKGK